MNTDIKLYFEKNMVTGKTETFQSELKGILH